jgi:branched-chain amino acid transport system ATP-binding protein
MRVEQMLVLEDAHTYRGPAHMVQGVSLNVQAAEVVCLVGRNGSGKTTIDSIMGLLPIRSGKIMLQERDISRLPIHERALEQLEFALTCAGVWSTDTRDSPKDAACATNAPCH